LIRSIGIRDLVLGMIACTRSTTPKSDRAGRPPVQSVDTVDLLATGAARNDLARGGRRGDGAGRRRRRRERASILRAR